jgi:hypothetical protein
MEASAISNLVEEYYEEKGRALGSPLGEDD